MKTIFLYQINQSNGKCIITDCEEISDAYFMRWFLPVHESSEFLQQRKDFVEISNIGSYDVPPPMFFEIQKFISVGDLKLPDGRMVCSWFKNNIFRKIPMPQKGDKIELYIDEGIFMKLID